MKKIILFFAALVAFASTASAEFQIRYKGYVDFGAGVMFPGDDGDFDSASSFSLSTSHGVEMFGGLFVGGGIDLTGAMYSREYSSGSYYSTELDGGFLGAVFADVRYNFLRNRKVSPFIGTRFGGGWQSFDEAGLFYFSIPMGCTFNFTKRFGLDVGLSYKLYNSTMSERSNIGTNRNPVYIDVAENQSYHNIVFTVGLHF